MLSSTPFSNVNCLKEYTAKNNSEHMKTYNVRLPNCMLLPHQKVAWNAKERLKKEYSDRLKMVILEWSRRQGKDILALNITAMEAYEYPSNNYYIFPEKRQAKEAIFEAIDADGRALIDYIPKELIYKIDKVTMTIYLYTKVHGALSTIQFKGSDADKMVGTSLRTVVFSEYALCNPAVWIYLEPSISMNKGLAIFVSTPRGLNHFTELIEANIDNPACYYSKLTIDMTVGFNNRPIFTRQEVEDKIKRGMPREQAMQEYYCSRTVALAGSFYKEQLAQLEEDGRCFNFNPPMYTQWYCSVDVGIVDLMVLWFGYVYDNKYYFFKCYANNYKTIKHYANVIDEFKKKYNIRRPIKLLLPHDSTKRDIVNNTSPIQEFERLGFECYLVKRSQSKINDINYIRQRIERMYFHKDNTFVGFNYLKRYTKKWNKTLNCFSEEELHDEASNFADSWKYFVKGIDGFETGETMSYLPG